MSPNHSTTAEKAARIFPGPDPIQFCRRSAVEELGRFDRALAIALSNRDEAYRCFLADLTRQPRSIHPTPGELLLEQFYREMRAAVRTLKDAVDFLEAARDEVEIRYYDERQLDRIEGRSNRDPEGRRIR